MGINIPAITERDLTRIVQAVRDLAAGRSNAVGTVTLRASQTTTVVSALTIGAASRIFLEATTANAAAVRASTYVSSVGAGTFTITHPSNSNTDKIFSWVALG